MQYGVAPAAWLRASLVLPTYQSASVQSASNENIFTRAIGVELVELLIDSKVPVRRGKPPVLFFQDNAEHEYGCVKVELGANHAHFHKD